MYGIRALAQDALFTNVFQLAELCVLFLRGDAHLALPGGSKSTIVAKVTRLSWIGLVGGRTSCSAHGGAVPVTTGVGLSPAGKHGSRARNGTSSSVRPVALWCCGCDSVS